MTSKTALVAGGTGGVGLSIVRALVKNNYNVFFIGTNKHKGLRIESELKKNYNTKICFVALDLSDLRSVKKYAVDFSEQNDQLDLLVNVAGVVLPKRQETQDGLEKTFAIGYLSAFILSVELTSLLEKSAHPRILNVSGGAALALKGKLNFSDLNSSKKYNGFLAAAKTVHAKTVLAEILSEKLLDKKIDVNAFHPGIVVSGLARNMAWPLRWLVKTAFVFLPKDSKTGVRACISDSLNGVTGQYLVDKNQIPLQFEKPYKEKLWQETEKILTGVYTR